MNNTMSAAINKCCLLLCLADASLPHEQLQPQTLRTQHHAKGTCGMLAVTEVCRGKQPGFSCWLCFSTLATGFKSNQPLASGTASRKPLCLHSSPCNTPAASLVQSRSQFLELFVHAIRNHLVEGVIAPVV